MRAVLIASLAACSSVAKPKPLEPVNDLEPTEVEHQDEYMTHDVTPEPSGVSGHLSIAGGTDAPISLRSGTVFLWWFTAERDQALNEGRFELQDIVDELTRLTILGPVDLTAPD